MMYAPQRYQNKEYPQVFMPCNINDILIIYIQVALKQGMRYHPNTESCYHNLLV